VRAKIRRGSLEEARIILEVPEPGIASIAKQSSNMPIGVAVIDA
jgi:hypothetical protein